MDHASLTTLESMNQALWYNRWTLNKLAKYLRGDMLEVGCGIGNFTPALIHYGRLWAFDVDAHAVAQTKKRVQKNVAIGIGNIETGKYFFGKKRFSSLVCLNVLEHVKDDQQALANMWQLLVPGGHLVLLVPTHPVLYGTIDKAIGHYRRYNPTMLTRQLRSLGFRIVFNRKLNMIGALGWFITGKILKRTSVSNRAIRLFNLFSPILLPVENIIPPPFGTSLLLIARKGHINQSAES